MPLLSNIPGDQLTEQLNHCFSVITNNLDTSYGREWFYIILLPIWTLFPIVPLF
jgi:hypothetical protein